MKDEKILDEEILSNKELENVAGGTYQEDVSLYYALSDNPKLNHYLKYSSPYGIHTEELSTALKETFGIDYETRDFKPNIYETKDGKFLNHDQVINMIKNYK